MKRLPSLQALFSALLVGCGPQIQVDGDEAPNAPDDAGNDAGDNAATSGDYPSTSGWVTTGAPSQTTGAWTTSPGPTTTGAWPDTDDGWVTSSGPVATTDSLPTGGVDGGDCSTQWQDLYEVTYDEVAPWLDANGEIPAVSCPEVCGMYGWGDVLGCTLYEEVGGSGSGSGTGSGTGTDGDTYVLECSFIGDCGSGRGHAALTPGDEACGDDPLGRFAGRMAHEEAGAVAAFAALAHELRAVGAPQDLLQRVQSATYDEVVHAEIMARIARARGVTPTRPKLGPVRPRSLEALACENAVEGCVRETWGALLATYQGHHATDPTVRAAMQRIAADETRHAELSRDLAAWLSTQLSDEANARVARARRRAIDAVMDLVAEPRDPQLDAQVGLPDPATAQRLLGGLREALWS